MNKKEVGELEEKVEGLERERDYWQKKTLEVEVDMDEKVHKLKKMHEEE